MFDKDKIINTLKETCLDVDCYWVVAGAAMVLHGVKAYTRDIDLGCNCKLADHLQQLGYKTEILDDGSRKIRYSPDIEIFEDWREGELEVIDAIPVVSLEGIVIMKQQLGREKDMEDIRLIREYIKINGGQCANKDLYSTCPDVIAQGRISR